MDIESLQQTLRDFAAARHWQRFHTPKHLSTALMVAAAELADRLFHLLQLADQCAIDQPAAVAGKLVRTAIKHPAAGAVLSRG